jgi:hypothetical protein
MEADWSVCLAADDPVITVPWAAAEDEGGGRFVDLRLDEESIDQIAEARANLPLRHALLVLNRAESSLWTAKCDVWTSSDESHDALEMDAEPGETAFGAGSYIDLLARDRETRQGFADQEQWLRRITSQLRTLPASAARVELVLRHAEVYGRPGFGVSWFVEGCGSTAELAEEAWARALRSALTVIMDSCGAE